MSEKPKQDDQLQETVMLAVVEGERDETHPDSDLKPKPEPEKKKNRKKAEQRREDALDFFRTLIISMAVLFVLSRFVCRPIRVQGSSMYPTLESGSLGLSNVIGYKTKGLQRFDIAIIYIADKKEYLVKRVVGLPGETIEYKDNELFVNGEKVAETFLDPDYMKSSGDVFTGDFGPITLGEDEYYCLGDNRPVSNDSRYYGPFSSDQIVAKGAFIFWPFSDFGVKSW